MSKTIRFETLSRLAVITAPLAFLASACSGPTAPAGPAGEPVGEAADAVTATCVTIQRGLGGTVEDTLLASDNPNKIHGTSNVMAVGVFPDGRVREALVRWDTSAVPASSLVTSAIATLDQGNLQGSGSTNVHEVLAPWSEATATWGSFNQAFASAVTGTLPGNAVDTVDLASLAQGWVDGSRPNHGVLLERSSAILNYWTSESTPAAQQPSLQVCYVPNPCAANPCQNGGACTPGAAGSGTFSCQCALGYTGNVCQTNICAGVVCPPVDACHAAGSCDPADGQCVAGPSLGDTATGLSHHWTFDEGSGSAALDSAGSAPGTLGSSAGWGTSFDGSGAIALSPTSTNDMNIYVDFGAAPGQLGTADFSVSFWVASTYNTSGLGDVVGNRVDPSNGDFFSCRLTAGGVVSGEIDNWGTDYNAASSAPVTINDGNWHNVVFARSGATFSEYVDGVLVNSATSAAPTNIAGAHPFKLGRSLAGYLTSFAAMYDDLRIYDRALGTCDVVDLVGSNAGKPAAFPPPPPPSCPCAGSPAWDSALAQTADFCDAGGSYVDLYYGGWSGEAFANSDPSFSSCYAHDPYGNYVEVDDIGTANADLCIAQLTPHCP